MAEQANVIECVSVDLKNSFVHINVCVIFRWHFQVMPFFGEMFNCNHKMCVQHAHKEKDNWRINGFFFESILQCKQFIGQWNIYHFFWVICRRRKTAIRLRWPILCSTLETNERAANDCTLYLTRVVVIFALKSEKNK